ncbi:MAG: hypothetical protein LBS01_10080 [Prevotellaceae bacterium]|jgi:hypothetical protein|nr:hypothetical protein [Prevotellaceae bacterium]
MSEYFLFSCTHKTNNVELKNDYYVELFDKQSNSKKQLLLALTQNGENIFSENYLKAYNLPNPSTLQTSVKGLLNDGIIDKRYNIYFICDPFFKLFLLKIKNC